jgi:hypothetical protein
VTDAPRLSGGKPMLLGRDPLSETREAAAILGSLGTRFTLQSAPASVLRQAGPLCGGRIRPGSGGPQNVLDSVSRQLRGLPGVTRSMPPVSGQ